MRSLRTAGRLLRVALHGLHGLAIVLLIYRNRRSVDIDQLDELKG